MSDRTITITLPTNPPPDMTAALRRWALLSALLEMAELERRGIEIPD